MQLLLRKAGQVAAKAVGKAVSKSKMFAKKKKGASKMSPEQMDSAMKKNYARSNEANKARNEALMNPKKPLKKANPLKKSMATKKK